MKNTKKFTSILLTLAMVISMMTMFASAANTVDSGDIGAARETKQNDPLVSSTAIGDIMTYDTDDPGSYTDTVRWMLDSDGVLTISGTGPTARFDSSYCPYLDRPAAGYNSPVAYNNNVKTVIIEESITDFDTDFISQYHQVSGESTMSGIETIIFMSASTHFNLNTERLPNLKNVLIGANLKDDAFDWTSTGVRHGMDASKFSGETLLLTKHGNGYSNNLVIRSDSDFALTDLDFYFGRDKTLNITQISFAEMLTHAQAALTDVPASVLTKLPAALRPAGAVNTPPPEHLRHLQRQRRHGRYSRQNSDRREAVRHTARSHPHRLYLRRLVHRRQRRPADRCLLACQRRVRPYPLRPLDKGPGGYVPF